MEGISMYLGKEEISKLFSALQAKYSEVSILMDADTDFGARLSRKHNPINEVGVHETFGFDNPKILETQHIHYICEHEMTPAAMIDTLSPFERVVFRHFFAGSFARSIYRIYEYRG